MSSRYVCRAVTLVLACTVLTGGSRAHRRMFPAFVMFRGGNLATPVLLVHSNVTIRNGVPVMDKDPLAIVYGSLAPAPALLVDSLRLKQHYDVAEYFGPNWTALTMPDGRPKRELKFEEASAHSRIYAGTAAAPPIWENPVVAPGGANRSFYLIGERGRRVLEGLGLRLR